jgi:hypothetical protein
MSSKNHTPDNDPKVDAADVLDHELEDVVGGQAPMPNGGGTSVADGDMTSTAGNSA